MFHNRRGHLDVKKTKRRFLDAKKDSQSRLRALRNLLDTFDNPEAKAFFLEHYSVVFYVFYDVFSSIESNAKQKGHRSVREELESAVFIFEKILILLPELLHKRWMFNSIARTLRKILHHGNIVKLRRDGVRLFILWYQALQENSDEQCHLIYACIIPGFPNPIDSFDWGKSLLSRAEAEELAREIRGPEREDDTSSSSMFYHLNEKETEGEWCTRDDILPIYPSPPSDRVHSGEQLTKFFLDRVLDCMSTQMVHIEWSDKKMRESAFRFLFENFKRFYLPHVFPDWNPKTILYDTTADIQSIWKSITVDDNVKISHLVSTRESVLRWFVAFTVRFRRNNESEMPSSPSIASKSMDSILTTGSVGSMPAATAADGAKSSTSVRNMEHLHAACDVVRNVLYSTKENVQLLHEVFRQGFLLPPRNINTIRQVLFVYQEWIKLPEKPIFMQEPTSESSVDRVDSPTSNVSLELSERPQSPTGRSWSYHYAVAGHWDHAKPNKQVVTENVRAGLQANLRLFILHSSEVFMAPEDHNFLEKQVDICRRVVHLYRTIVLEVPMETKTWEQLLLVLLEVCRHLLGSEISEEHRPRSLAGLLAGSLLQTLFVTWIRANLKVNIPVKMWDMCMDILSQITHWAEVINEWATTMETLTRVLARTLYGLDLGDLPLDRLSEQKRKRRRYQISEKSNFNRTSFTRWSKMETNSPRPILSNAEQITNKGGSPIVPKARRPMASSISVGSGVHVPTEGHKQLRTFSSAGSAFKSTVPSVNHDEDSFTDAAGSATVVSSNAAGQQLSSARDSVTTYKESCSIVESQTPGVTRLLSSDSDSNESGDTRTKDTESELSVSSIISKQRDFVNLKTPSPLLRQNLDCPDNYIAKTMAWDSMDSEYSEFSDSSVVDQHEEVRRISETSIEYTPSLRHAWESLSSDGTVCTDQASTPAGDGDTLSDATVRASLASLPRDSDLGDDSSDHNGSRSSPDLSGQDSLEPQSRSPSPPDILSTGQDELLEFGEEKDDSDSEEEDEEEDISVLAGGTREGWGMVASAVLWRRMLGILGNVNKIKVPSNHAKVFECLSSIWNMLAKVRLNQGISLDNKVTPPLPVLLPPLQFFATWVFEACSMLMSNNFKNGRLLAYNLMCSMTVRHQDSILSQEYLTHFYRLLHIGLTGTEQDVNSAIIKNCSHFFSMVLPSSSLLILDFIQAVNLIFINQSMELPRAEAVTLVGSLLCYPNTFGDMPLHQPGHQTNEYQATSKSQDIKEKLISVLLRSAKLDPSCKARCIALNSLGIFVVEELVHNKGHQKIHDCICVILASITFHHKAICHVAIDLMHLLSEFYDELQALDEDLPAKIIEVLCHTVTSLLPGGEMSQVQDDNKILSKLLLCLLDWTILVPVPKLLARKGDGDISVISRIFQVLKSATTSKALQKRRKSLNISAIIFGDARPIRLARIADSEKRVSSNTHSPSGRERGDDFEDNCHGTGIPFSDVPPKSDPVRLTAKAVLSHLLNHWGHFPLGAGSSRLDSYIGEHEDNPSVDCDEVSTAIFTSPNLQFCVMNDNVLVSLVEIPCENLEIEESGDNPTRSKTQVRIITRDMNGKHAWDFTLFYGPSPKREIPQSPFNDIISKESEETEVNSEKRKISSDQGRSVDSPLKSMKSGSAISPDKLDEVLGHIGSSSKECLIFPDLALNEPAPSPENLEEEMQFSVMDAVLEQHDAEQCFVKGGGADVNVPATEVQPPVYVDSTSPFQLGRFLISEVGLLTWEKRARIDLLKRNEKFLRELKNLDSTRCRETHKIAVLYVAEGQEDKNSIMSNSSGSQEYEDFVAGLGWEVDLSTHTGFMGGLEKNLSTGATAPYFASSTMEVMFHVSTRMPLPADITGFNKKVRHLGNDEVHIVWSEHTRDYRYGIVNTEFGDVLIVIYPLPNRLFRIQIIKKPMVPPFGPLYDGAIVDRRVLPVLVRATAVNASLAKRSLLPLYERYYEERVECIKRIVSIHKEHTSFEEFSSKIFFPAPKLQSRPATPASALDETPALTIPHAQTAPGNLDGTTFRHRSQSSVLTHSSAKDPKLTDRDLAATALSLPDGLDRVESTDQEGAVSSKQEKKRVSLKWRNKQSSAALAEEGDSE